MVRRALGAAALLAALVACEPQVKAGERETPPLNSTTTTLPPNAGVPGREAVSCDSSYFDSRSVSADEPLGLPLGFPGAPDESDLCGVDTRTAAVAYTSPLPPDEVFAYYSFLLPIRGCPVEPLPPDATSGDLELRYLCPDGSGTVVIAADAGAYDVIPDDS